MDRNLSVRNALAVSGSSDTCVYAAPLGSFRRICYGIRTGPSLCSHGRAILWSLQPQPWRCPFPYVWHKNSPQLGKVPYKGLDVDSKRQQPVSGAMALTLTNDPNVLDANPVKYSRALQIAAGGHVLWHPSHIVRDGGIIGDCGYFDGGRFQVLFNVFDPPNELDIPALPHPTGRELRVEELPNYNTILQSSQSHTVRVEASLESPPLPNLPVLKVGLAAHAAVSDQTIAFLAFCGPRRRTDWYAKTNALEKYLVQYEDKILQHFGDYPIRSGNVVIVNGSTRAVSWWGGISHSHSTSVSGRAGIVDGTGVSVEVDNTHNWPWIFSRGPEIWEEDCDPNRSLILRVVSIKRRLPILRATRKVFTTISDFAGAGLRREWSRNASTAPLGDSAAGVSSDLGARDNQADGGRDLLADHSERLSEILGRTDLGEADDGLDEQDEDGDLDNSLLADQPDLLSEMLDLVLNTYPDIDVAVGSWETIADFVKLLRAASGDDVVEPIITRFREGTDVVAQLLNLQLRASTPRTNPRSSTSYASPTTGDYTKSVPRTSTDGHATSGGLLQIDTPLDQAASSALNKSAQTATSLYQQCSQLRERLMRVHDFQPYLALASQARFRHSTDPVDHLWGCLALGVPLCFLFNLLPGPQRIEINADPEDIDPDDRQARQRATAAFVINIIQLQKATGDWEEDVGFEIRDLIDDERNTTGFAKVVRTVTALLDRLPQHVFMHDIPPIPPLAPRSPGGVGPPRADLIASMPPWAREEERQKIIDEILFTERKYVGDLEIMQHFANELATRNIIDRDTIDRMFPNLPALCDFQQRFLSSMEQVANQPWPQQRWGRLFAENEERFQAYEPYYANYSNAKDLVMNEGSTLQGFTSIISASELPAFLTIPIQRVCKYPLLLENLIKASQGSDYPYLDELRAGLASVKRTADKINEAERRMDNERIVKALESRVEDWRGYSLSFVGDLLLDDIFTVTRSGPDREHHVFLFEKILLLCKESTSLNDPRKGFPSLFNKQDNMPFMPSVGVDTAVARKRTTPLRLRSWIFWNNVTEASSQLVNGMWLLHVRWKSEDGQEQFALHCNNKEQLDLWETAINRRIQEIHARRASEKAEKAATMRVGRQLDHTNPAVPPHDEKNYFTAPSSQSSTLSDSSLPPYPGPLVAEFPWIGSKNAPPRSARVDFYPVSQKYGSAPFEDDAADSLDAISGYAQSTSRRGTPGRRGIATKSMAPERDLAPGYEPNRARTADPNGRLFRQWTHGSPTVFAPTGELPTPPTWGVGRQQQRSQFDSTRLRNEYDSYGQPLPRYLEVKPSDQSPPRLPDGSLTVSRRANADAGDGSNKYSSGSRQRTDGDGSDSDSHSMRQQPSESQGTPPATPLSLPIRVRVYYGEDLFVIGVPRTTKFDDLMDSIGKKIRLCDPHREDRPLRVKYRDDEGDMVSLASNEDMQIALESSQVAFHVQ